MERDALILNLNFFKHTFTTMAQTCSFMYKIEEECTLENPTNGNS